MSKNHCCEYMTSQVDYFCEKHKDSFECVNNLIFYSVRFDEYGITIHDGGSSYSLISFCPWCGKRLPESKRDLWFNTLEKLGYKNPFEQDIDIPEEFESDRWYSK